MKPEQHHRKPISARYRVKEHIHIDEETGAENYGYDLYIDGKLILHIPNDAYEAAHWFCEYILGRDLAPK